MRQIPLQIRNQRAGEHELDFLVGLGLGCREAQTIALPLAQQVNTDLDRSQIAPTYWPSREQRDQQAVSEVLGPVGGRTAGGAVCLIHQLDAEGKELTGWHKPGLLVPGSYGASPDQRYDAPHPSPIAVWGHRPESAIEVCQAWRHRRGGDLLEPICHVLPDPFRSDSVGRPYAGVQEPIAL